MTQESTEQKSNGTDVKVVRGSKIFVGNISRDATEEQISQLFSAYAEVKKVKFLRKRVFTSVKQEVKDEKSGETKIKSKRVSSLKFIGSGFVTFNSSEDAQSVLEKVMKEGIEFNGQKLKVENVVKKQAAASSSASSSKSKEENAAEEKSSDEKKENQVSQRLRKLPKKGRKIGRKFVRGFRRALNLDNLEPTEKSAFITNLSFETTEDQLSAFFKELGYNVNSVEIKYLKPKPKKDEDAEPPKPRSKGSAVVEFGTSEERDRALEEISKKKELGGRTITVRVAVNSKPTEEADTKEE